MALRDAWQELRELGARRTAFRLGWELRTRLRGKTAHPAMSGQVPLRVGFADPVAVAGRARGSFDRAGLLARAQGELRGTVRCFGAWTADFGDPPDWHVDPSSGRRSDPSAPWPRALAEASRHGDVKLIWEIGRFPHAYSVTRAACCCPGSYEELASGLLRQMRLFVEANPYGRGVHWASGQEIVFRLMAWMFALDALLGRTSSQAEASRLVAEALFAGAVHVEEHIGYARFAVYNNHLLSEALGLFLAGVVLPGAAGAERWRRRGREILEEEAGRQFYADGAYIQQSHNYHRLGLQDLLWACLVARAGGEAPAPAWLAAMERSLDFLLAHQNPADGRLPNYGFNDGALPSVLSSCDFSDFRPTLQAVSLQARGERVYPEGPWDEEAAWFLGPEALHAPLRDLSRRSVSFSETGYHVLRGEDAGSFCAFRCGSLRDRFSQIDMLHLDVWWRGQNVLVDGGSYLYNGPAQWNEHFVRTASHNTVVVDERDQMLHFRKFKVLYWTQAKLLKLDAGAGWRAVAGEHYGYRRHPGRCAHRRSVLMAGDDLWVVADTVTGTGSHRARLHWLCGDFPHAFSLPENALSLETPAGAFGVRAYDLAAEPLPAGVARGQESPPRGWLSRCYGLKVAVPSFEVLREGHVPLSFLSVLGAGSPVLARRGEEYVARGASQEVRFRLQGGIIRVVAPA